MGGGGDFLGRVSRRMDEACGFNILTIEEILQSINRHGLLIPGKEELCCPLD
jgi:hypothetical protein